MSLVPSLLQAVIGLDGEALVIHVGEKPYVVAPSGQVELATRALTFEAVTGILEQMLPGASRQALEEFGAIQYELPPLPQFHNEHFTVVAARGGDDVWVEVRRRRTADDDVVPADIFETSEPMPAHDPASMQPESDLAIPEPGDFWPDRTDTAEAQPAEFPSVREVASFEKPSTDDLDLPDSIEIDPPAPRLVPPGEAAKAPKVTLFPIPARTMPPAPPPVAAETPPPLAQVPVQSRADIDVPTDEPIAFKAGAFDSIELEADTEPEVAPPPVRTAPPLPPPAPRPTPESPPVTPRQPITPAAFIPPPPPDPEPEPEPESIAAPPPRPSPEPTPIAPLEPEPEMHPAVVLPMSRVSLHGEPGQMLTGLDRLLRIAAARGASTLYVASKARPSIRVNGEMQMLDEPALGPDDVESLLIELMPDRNRDALRTGVGTEWVCDIAEVGRVSCMSFRDHRGAGGIFRMTPMRAISAEQLGLSREIRALATESEGLVLITGPRSSGKTTLLSAFVDLINRSRRVYVITIESDIRVVHESRHSLVSQREARDDHTMLEALRTALREEPDVLVIEEMRAAEMVSLALDAAGAGRFVIATVPAQTAVGAIEHLVGLAPADQRRPLQLALAENLRGIVAQVLVRKPGGGQMAARELLLNSSAVSSLIAEGKLSQIGPTMESGRKYGMVPLNDALVACVKSGEVEAREAYRRAADRVGFLALLKRQGIDTTFVERPA